MKTVTLKKVELEPEEQKKRKSRFSSLSEAFYGASADRMFDTCKRRKLEVIVNTVEDGRVVASIEGCIGIARSLITALRKAASAWDRENKPRVRRKKRS
jgi:hypothetical protein